MRRRLAAMVSVTALALTGGTANANPGDDPVRSAPSAGDCFRPAVDLPVPARPARPALDTSLRPRDTVDPTPAQVREMLADLALRAPFRRPDRPNRPAAARITVPVAFHVLAPDGTATGRPTAATINAQIRILNDAYGGVRGGVDTGFRFRLASTDTTVNAAWFRDPIGHETAYKPQLRKGGTGTLNLYSADVGQAVLGYATFPQTVKDKPALDGVVIDHRSMPRGTYANYDLGFTAVHEVGHWLGLFHTFENGCNAPGDGVADTPDQATASDGCPEGKDTCTTPGADPVHNYMDYSYDACMKEFTRGQADRLRRSWTAYRNGGAGSLR
ncbi:pregnancy-associated plasma protein-A [Actinocorallia herbida]|uniref:Pregnancy-associated plasma protein-A n=1 Tax=Actinocorallia herbida TaxID=58109 RepID=A0A3N1D9Q0_9ACTN|nr:zinc metalloprotease [Actinocorallia herbida]ROO89828.1 pregnancy-associated plasma protein-A [Actinocorallia herbida]